MTKTPPVKKTEPKPVKAAVKAAVKVAVKTAVTKAVAKVAPKPTPAPKKTIEKKPVVKETPVTEAPAKETPVAKDALKAVSVKKKPAPSAKAKLKAEKEAELARRLGRARNSLMNAVGEVMKDSAAMATGVEHAKQNNPVAPVRAERTQMTMTRKPDAPMSAPNPFGAVMTMTAMTSSGLRKASGGKIDLDELLKKRKEQTPAKSSDDFEFRK